MWKKAPQKRASVNIKIFQKSFLKLKKAQQGLLVIDSSHQPGTEQGPPQDNINQLISPYQQGQLAVVFGRAQALTQQYPKSFALLIVLGAANKGLNQPNEASKAFKKVTEINPNYANGYNSLGIIPVELSKFSEALGVFKSALALKLDYSEGHYNMGNALKKQGLLEETVEACSKSLELQSNTHEAYCDIRIALRDKDLVEKA